MAQDTAACSAWRVPLDYAKTEMGAQEVENLLSQLGHGSPS